MYISHTLIGTNPPRFHTLTYMIYGWLDWIGSLLVWWLCGGGIWNWRCWFNTSGFSGGEWRWRRRNGRLNDWGYVECFALLYVAFVYKNPHTHTVTYTHNTKHYALPTSNQILLQSRTHFRIEINMPSYASVHTCKSTIWLFFATRFLFGANASDSGSPFTKCPRSQQSVGAVGDDDGVDDGESLLLPLTMVSWLWWCCCCWCCCSHWWWWYLLCFRHCAMWSVRNWCR